MREIRLATKADARQILDIYSPFCGSESAVSFEIVPPSLAEMEMRIENTLVQHPWLVAERDGKILGYAYAGSHKQRAAYRWSTDVSVYIHEDARRTGMGRALYEVLFSILRRQGFVNAYAGVTLPNPSSVALHSGMGFASVGVYHQVGFKAGTWHDVAWFEMQLQERKAPPAEPISIQELVACGDLASSLSASREFRARADR